MISKEQYVRLYEALWKVNGLSRPEDSEEPVAFLEYSGHTNSFRLRFYEDGWIPFCDPTFCKDVLLDSEDAHEDIEDCIEALESLAKANEEYHLRKATKVDERTDVMAELDKIQASFMAQLNEFRKKFGCQDL